jgi:calcineurin-like phosphoesterase family protein
MCHDPALANVLPEDSILLCGHVHNLFKTTTSLCKNIKVINVGVDIWDFTPVSIEQIYELLE